MYPLRRLFHHGSVARLKFYTATDDDPDDGKDQRTAGEPTPRRKKGVNLFFRTGRRRRRGLTHHPASVHRTLWNFELPGQLIHR